jgi:O-antigen/teichoic acid export membrane protein
MGIRMFVIYGLPLGLLLAGPLIASFGFFAMATAYCLAGAGLTGLVALYWRTVLWSADAPVNRSR